MTTPGRAHIRWFRNTAPYINAHRGKTFVLMFGGEVARDDNFPNIIHDIALLNSLGVKLVLIHGSRPQIEDRLQAPGRESDTLTALVDALQGAGISVGETSNLSASDFTVTQKPRLAQV